jgi:hypothetical protein
MAWGLTGGSGDSYPKLHARSLPYSKGPGRSAHLLLPQSAIVNQNHNRTARRPPQGHSVTALLSGNEAAGERREVVDAEGLLCKE